KGLGNAEIAETEHVSVATVKTQITAILRKLGLSSRVQVAIFAYEHGILRPGSQATSIRGEAAG
ncbi:MAG: response regulator transcription factor, partial [Actinobacteria bacterium]|nr:response regulator transcription factor [Actinomycetota bacterium]